MLPERQTLGVQAASRLRDSILAGELKPGEKLVERRLAEALKVSQTSVREALQVLEHEGLVTKKVNTATYVTELQPRQIAEIIDLRLDLEVKAFRLARKNLSPQDVHELESILAGIDDAAANNDYFSLSRGDFRFHQKLWGLSGNKTLERVLTQLCTPLFAYLMVFLSVGRLDLSGSVKSHRALVNVLRHGDAKRMRRAVEDHLKNLWFKLLEEAS